MNKEKLIKSIEDILGISNNNEEISFLSLKNLDEVALESILKDLKSKQEEKPSMMDWYDEIATKCAKDE